MEELAPIIANIQDKWLAIAGIKAAPDHATEFETAMPFVMTYERTGEMLLQSAGWSTPYTTLYSELHISRALLPSAISAALTFRNLFLKKIRSDPTLGDTCVSVTQVKWTFGNLEWAGESNIGYRFELMVKTHLVSV